MQNISTSLLFDDLAEKAAHFYVVNSDTPRGYRWHYRARICVLVLGLLVILSAESETPAADGQNRTLFGNKAVQRELKLTDEQQATFNQVLADLEDELQAKLKAALAEADAKADWDKTESKITDEVVNKHGQRLMAVLDKEQMNRFWQIGAQGAGPAIFNDRRVRRVLQFSDEQLEKMSQLSKQMIEATTKAALDVEMPIAKVQATAEKAKSDYTKSVLALLTEQQRADFDKLMGKPFDQELLKNPDGLKPRSLTFVFGISGQNKWMLLSVQEIAAKMDMGKSTYLKTSLLREKADKELTTLRLATLKSADADFPELKPEEQQKVVRTILDGAAKIDRETNRELDKILNDDQRKLLTSVYIQFAGARAIQDESVAETLKLTAAQKDDIAKLNAKFERQTAPLRVVRKQADFDQKSYDQQLKELEAAMRRLLTDEQRKQFDELGK